MSIGSSSDHNATKNTVGTEVTIADDGTACAIWFDGTDSKFSYTSSPYSSWTTATLTSGASFAAGALLDASDNVAVLDGVTTGEITYFPLTKSGSTYSVGSSAQVTTASAVSSPEGHEQIVLKDGQGRYWSISDNQTRGHVIVYQSATPGVANWTASLSQVTSGELGYPAADIVGDYLVVCYPVTGGFVKYRRLDVSGASLGTWSTEASVPVYDSANVSCFRSNGLDTAMLVQQSGSGIAYLKYTASTDTWGVAALLSTQNSDLHPTLIRDTFHNDLYCFWCEWHTNTSYALVYNKWSAFTQSWDVVPTTVVGAGSNIAAPNGGYGNHTIIVEYTVGTANPYSVESAVISIPDPALTVFGLQAASSTLSTADQMASAVGGTDAFTTTLIGTATGYGELWSQGNASAWAAAGSMGTPTGRGYLFDVTTLELQTILAGNWTPSFTLALSSAKTTFTATLYCNVYQRSAAGAYTQIGTTMSMAANLTTAKTVYTMPASGQPLANFAVGDKLYVDVWLQILTSTGGLSTDTVKLWASSHATLGMASQVQVITPGYAPTPLAKTLYGTAVADATLATACQMTTNTGGVETSKLTTWPTGGGVYGEVFSQGTTTGVSSASIPATPSGNGWVYTPEAGTFATGNWSAVVTTSSVGGASDWTIRFFKYSGGTYTLIGSILFSGGGTAKAAHSFTATSMPSMPFSASDRLYTDLWFHDSTGAGGDNPTIYEGTTATAGVSGDMQVTTSVFTPASPPPISHYVPRVGGSTLVRTFVPRVGGSTLIRYVGVVASGTAATLKAAGRFRMVAQRTLSSAGRAAFKVGHTLSAQGRAVFRAGRTWDASGRALFVARATRDGIGRFSLGIRHTLSASGRASFIGHTLRNGMGRAVFQVRRTQDAAGRVIIVAQHSWKAAGRAVFIARHTLSSAGRAAFRVAITRDASGRAVFVVRHTLLSAGRLRIIAGRVRNASGRFFLVVRRTLSSSGRAVFVARNTRQGMGRVVFLKRHSWQGLGRFILLAPGTMTRKAQGRFRLIVARTQDAAGRFRLTVLHRLSASGRAVFIARHTLSSAGRAAFTVVRTRVAQGRAVFVARRTRAAQGRLQLRVGHRLSASGRAAWRAARTQGAVGRFRLMILGGATKNGSGRFVLSVEVDLIVYSARGTIVPQAARGTVTVEGASGELVTEGARGNIIVEAARGTVVVEGER